MPKPIKSSEKRHLHAQRQKTSILLRQETALKQRIKELEDNLALQRRMKIDEKFRILAQTSPTAIMMYQDNKYIYANPAAEMITGYSQKELLQMNFWDIVHPDFLDLAKKRGQARQKGINVIKRYELKIITKTREERWADLSGNIVEVSGRPAGIVNIVDITDHKNAVNRMEYLSEYSINMLARSAEIFDSDTGNHTSRIGNYSEMLALAIGAPEDFAKSIQLQAQLHDVGKIYVHHELLNKPGDLTGDEFEIVKRHTINGARIIGRNPSFELAHQIALYHHERWDGSGYPYGLKYDEIPLAARIVSIVDVFDALVTQRSYKEPFNYDKTFTIMSKGDKRKGFDPKKFFDPSILSVFLSNYNKFIDIYEKSIIREEEKQRHDMDVLIIDDDLQTIKLFMKYYQHLEGIHVHAYRSVADMQANIKPVKALNLCFVNPSLSDGSGHEAALELKRLHPHAHFVCLSAENEYIDKDRRFPYDRIFHKPIDSGSILEITETVRKYYFSTAV